MNQRVPNRGTWKRDHWQVTGETLRRVSPKGVERRAIESETGPLSPRQFKKLRKLLRRQPQEP
jgi:hypothetical protein